MLWPFDGPERNGVRLAQRRSRKRDEAESLALNARLRSPVCAEEECSGQSVEQPPKWMRLRARKPEISFWNLLGQVTGA